MYKCIHKVPSNKSFSHPAFQQIENLARRTFFLRSDKTHNLASASSLFGRF